MLRLGLRFALLVTAATALPSSISSPLVNRSQLPFFDDVNAEIEVHMLEKHIYNQDDVKDKTTKFLAKLNDFIPLFHVSLGLRERHSGREIALEYIGAAPLLPMFLHSAFTQCVCLTPWRFLWHRL